MDWIRNAIDWFTSADVSVLELVTALGTLVAAIYTAKAARSSQASAIASREAAKIANETMERASRPEIVATVATPVVIVEWFIENRLPVFTVTTPVGVGPAVNMLNVGAGYALDAEVELRVVEQPPSVEGFGFGLPDIPQQMHIKNRGSHIQRDWLHEPMLGPLEEVSQEIRLKANPVPIPPRQAQRTLFPPPLVRDLAWGSLTMLKPLEDQFSLKGQTVRIIQTIANYRDSGGTIRETAPTRISIRISDVELFGEHGKSVLADRPNYRMQGDQPQPISPWNRAIIKLDLEAIPFEPEW